MAKVIAKINKFMKLQSKLNVEIGEAISATNKVVTLTGKAVRRLLLNNSNGHTK
jgi:hypothetical protein